MALDLLLNMNISINQLLGYVLEKCGPEKTAEVYKTLKALKNKPRKLALIPYTALKTTQALEAFELCCEWLTKKDKKHTYFFPLDEAELYDIFHLNFKKPNPNHFERFEATKSFNNTIQILNNAGLFEGDTRNQYRWNCLYYYDKDGFLWIREIPDFLDVLFNCNLQTKYKLIVEIY